MKIQELLENFTNSRNNNGKIIAAFGYGSALFKQTGYSLQEKPMIDTIFVVENPHLWHLENIKRNPKDYSISGRIILKYFDVNLIRRTAGITYQSNIKFMDRIFKYGIIGKKKFMDAMSGDWDNFFIQGRFQKPTFTIFSTDEIDDAIKENRFLALFVALLTLQKDKPTLTDLYFQICSLSYKGDVRMLFIENPNKVSNIVMGNFRELYDIYGDENEFFYTKENGEIVINKDLLYETLSILPTTLYEYLEKHGYLLSHSGEIASGLNKRLTKINCIDSIIQPLSGIATVGPVRSLSYIKNKLKKKTMKHD